MACLSSRSIDGRRQGQACEGRQGRAASPGLRLEDPPYARLRGRLSAWRRIGAPSRVLQWIHTGAPLQWGPSGPPPPFDQGEYPLRSEEEWAAWRTLRDDYLATGAIVRTAPSSDARISRAFLVAKPSEDGQTKFRLVIDLRRVNRHLRKVGLKYERLKDFGYLLKNGDFLVGFDVRNAYHHIRMRKDEENFLMFRMGGETFFCRALSFGLALTPFYFTQVMLVVARFLRSPSILSQGSPEVSVWTAGGG